MKYLGIDYGSKRLGLAFGDDVNFIATPKMVFPNDKFLLRDLKEIIQKYEIDAIVCGDSKDSNMNDNPIMKDAKRFMKLLEVETGKDVFFELEFMSSHQAERTNHELEGRDVFVDASAAAIILQSYLEKIKNNI